MPLDDIETPDMKWVFVRVFNVEVKVMLDIQPLSGTTPPLPDWLPKICSPPRNGGTGHLQRQLVPLALHCSSLRGPPRLEHTNCERVGKELLQHQNSTNQHRKNFT